MSCLYVSEQTLALPDSRKGMEDARRPSEAPFSSSINPSVGHPLNVANEAAVTRSERASERAREEFRRRPRRGRKSRRGLIRAWRTLGDRRRRGRSNNSALYFLRRIFFRARKVAKRNKHYERINGNWCCVILTFNRSMRHFLSKRTDIYGDNGIMNINCSALSTRSRR